MSVVSSISTSRPATRKPSRAEKTAEECLERAWGHLRSIQDARGFWVGETEWNTMITAQVVIVRTIVGRPAADDDAAAMLLYFRSTQLDDGSWGMHPSSDGYVFTTALTYVAMRLLGVPADDPGAARALSWLRQHGGVAAIPTWGKVWLALLGLYEWSGVNPVPPEIWLTPEWNPLHPSRYYCHTRLIYLPIGYLYGVRFRAAPSPRILAIRDELWGSADAYRQTDFASLRHALAPTDVFVAPSRGLRLVYNALAKAERFVPTWLRARACRRTLELIEYELHTTRHACISPVSGLLNIVALYASNAFHPDIPRAIDALQVWRWQDDERGARYAGANSHTWDTSFAIQALMAGPLAERPDVAATLARAHHFLEDTQLLEPLVDGEAHYRAPREGGWCFSDDAHLWPVSDTTAEALAALLPLQARVAVKRPLDATRLRAAADFVMLRQNPDGGWGSYERRRGSLLLETMNPNEMYGACMTERSYTECTASCVKALAAFDRHCRELGSDGSTPAVRQAIERGVEFLRARQLDDGSWSAVWAVQYTYGTLFAVEALLAAGASPQDPAIRRARAWVRSVQKPDGSWGEHWRSCLEHRYIEHEEGQAAMTAWALMTLVLAQGDPASDQDDASAIERGVAFLSQLQSPDGSWPRQDVAGVFFHTAMLDYALYKDIFPIWALQLYLVYLTRRARA